MKGLSKKIYQSISGILVVALLLMICPQATFAGENDVVYNSSNDSLACNVNVINDEKAIINVEDKILDKDYKIYINTGSDVISETYDENNVLQNRIVREGDELVQYDADGNVLVRNNIKALEEAVTVENSDESNLALFAIRDTWDPIQYVSSNIHADINSQAAALSYLVTVVAYLLDVGSLASILLGALNDLAAWMVTNRIPNLWYKGWKQYGWQMGYRVVRCNLNFYRYSNYTGFVKNVSGTQGVH